MESRPVVISLGGSIISPDGVDTEFLARFKAGLEGYLQEDPGRSLILVCGGGSLARAYQKAYGALAGDSDPVQADWLGIRATHLNGALVKALFGDLCQDPLVTDPTAEIAFRGRILVAAGWKPGFSTDTDAVLLARRFGASLVVNLSNIKKVYTEDPRSNPDARPLDSISWDDFCKMVGSEWRPGINVPFDPVASPMARDAGIQVVCADGRNIPNTLEILRGRPYEGTLIG